LCCGLTVHEGVAEAAASLARGIADIAPWRVILAEAQGAEPPLAGMPAGGAGFTDLLASGAAAGLAPGATGAPPPASPPPASPPPASPPPASQTGNSPVAAPVAAPVAPALTVPSDHPRLRLVGVGRHPGRAAAGAMMAAELPSALAALRAEAEILVLIGAPLHRAPATASLARHAEAVVLFLHPGEDRRADTARAVDEIEATGSRLLGAVLLT
jgi:hypothetical protein